MSQTEHTTRRKRLMQMMGKGSIAIIPAAPVTIRNRDVEHRYRPDSDFYYLTGFAEPEAVAVIIPKRKHGEYILFCRERDPAMETWVGPRAGLDGAREFYGADDAFPITDIAEILPGLLENRDRVFYTMGCNPTFDQQIISWVNQIRDKARSGVSTPNEFVALDHLLHDMRLFKSRHEVSVMRKASKIAARAHIRAMQKCKPGMSENEIEAEILHYFRVNNCTEAYPSIVGGGANSCILHYIDNREPLNDGDLLLIDAGAEKDYYASDITRTFPVNGKYSKEQRAIYNLVLQAQEAAIKQVKTGNHWNDPHNAAVKVITRGLVKLGILKGDVRKLIKDHAYRRFYMHRTGHWIGMDVHDVGDYKVGDEWRVLEPGMVLTIEPGIYIPAGSKKVAKKWWNIGIRIEDDVLVTKNGPDVLTKDVPKKAAEIEAIMAAAQVQ